MASHRHQLVTEADFDSPWKLSMFRRRYKSIKRKLIGCAVCYPKKPITIRKVTRIDVMIEEYDV